jgi:hypothetical protein
VYRITKTLDIRKGIVFRGAGKALTTLYFPFSLTQVYGNTWSEVRSYKTAIVNCDLQHGQLMMIHAVGFLGDSDGRLALGVEHKGNLGTDSTTRLFTSAAGAQPVPCALLFRV